MTSTPSLSAQIEAVRAAIARREQQTEGWSATESEIPKLMAVLVTLQQHERLPERPSAVVAAACIVGDWQDRHELADNLPAAVLDDLKLSIRRALQQHERLEAEYAILMSAPDAEWARMPDLLVRQRQIVAEVRAGAAHDGDCTQAAHTCLRCLVEDHDALARFVANCLAALDTAAPETPADNCLVEPVITPEMLRAGISVAEAHFLRAHGAWRDLVVAVYRAMYLSRPSPSGETEAALSRKDAAENGGGRP